MLRIVYLDTLSINILLLTDFFIPVRLLSPTQVIVRGLFIDIWISSSWRLKSLHFSKLFILYLLILLYQQFILWIK